MTVRRWLLLLLLTSFMIIIGLGLYFRADFITQVQAIITDLDFSTPYASALLVLIQIFIVISGLVPAAMLGIAAGAAYGMWIGFLLSATGTLLGAIIAFLLSRSFLRSLIYYLLGSRQSYLLKLDQAIKKHPWKTVCLLRLSPILPFSVGSYAFGLTTIDFLAYFLGSLAALPGLFIYVMLGSLGQKALWEDAFSSVYLILMSIGTLATLILIVHLGRIANREHLLMTE